VDGDRWTYYDLGCMYDLWFEILQDFIDYQDYMGLSLMVQLCKWSLLGLISYNLGSSVTEWYQSQLSQFHGRVCRSCAGMVCMAGVDLEWSHSMAHALALDARMWPRGNVPGSG